MFGGFTSLAWFGHHWLRLVAVSVGILTLIAIPVMSRILNRRSLKTDQE